MILKNVKWRQQTEQQFQEALHFALAKLGWMLPETEAAVRECELDELDEQDQLDEQLPPGLQDPLAALKRPDEQ